MTTVMTKVLRMLAPGVFAIVGPLLLLSGAAAAQSGSRNFPTPITSNEISGTIRARDLGDARLTTYYYSFIGNQGDIFVNVVTKNFDGDIDVFTADTLKPLTKIVIYSDSSDKETGRVVYMRQAQKLLLRIEGRTPNDEPATFRIKFAGSFAPSTEVASADPKLTDKPENEDAEVRVNSVGTIIAAKPKPTPVEREVEPVTVEKKSVEVPVEAKVEPVTTEPSKTEEPETDTEAKTETPKLEVIVTDELPKPKASETETPAKPKAPARVKPNAQTRRRARSAAKTEPTPKPEPAKPDPNPLENIKLIVLFKDGTKIERPMSEVLKVSVDKGILTIIHKDGSIGRYSILDIARMTIE